MKVKVQYYKTNPETGAHEPVDSFTDVRSVKVEEVHDKQLNEYFINIYDTQEYV